MDMFSAVPIFIGIVFVLVIGGILFNIVRGVSQWSYNNAQPVQALPAKVVAKRTATSGNRMMNTDNMGGNVWTTYYATFETEGGDRSEFSVSSREYGLLAEGDQGTLTSQGTRYQRFERQRG